MKLVLVSCCAPCSAGAIKELVSGKIPDVDDFIVYFYNPNIFPMAEYQKRLGEQVRYCESMGVKYHVDEYDHDAWRAAVRGMEDAPERGPRCSACFAFRFARAARYATDNGYDAISSVLGVSRHKSQSQVDAAGMLSIMGDGHPPSLVATPPANGGGNPRNERIGGGNFHVRRYTNFALAQSKHLKRNMTDAERLLWSYLRGRKDFSFRKQAPIGNYIVDFVCLSKKLVIELDGAQHGDEVHRTHDTIRDKFLIDSGYRILRFWNDEVFKKMDMVLDAIHKTLTQECPPPIGPRTTNGCEGDVLAGGGPALPGRGVANKKVRYISIPWDDGLRQQINRESDFYRQKYCGCEFSIRK